MICVNPTLQCKLYLLRVCPFGSSGFRSQSAKSGFQCGVRAPLGPNIGLLDGQRLPKGNQPIEESLNTCCLPFGSGPLCSIPMGLCFVKVSFHLGFKAKDEHLPFKALHFLFWSKSPFGIIWVFPVNSLIPSNKGADSCFDKHPSC